MSIHKTGGLRSFVLPALLLAMIGAPVLFPGSARADDLQDAVDKWVGAWDVVADRKDKFTLTLQQVRLRLNGTYAPGNGQARGSVYDGVLNLYWSQDGNVTGVKTAGRAQLKLSADGKSFSGTSKTDGEDKAHSWTGTLQPGSGAEKAISFGGTWSGTYNNGFPLLLTLSQTGDTFTGVGEVRFSAPFHTSALFTLAEGKINVKDGTLTFKVYPVNSAEIQHAGVEKLVLLPDGKTLQGTLGGRPAVAGKIEPVSFTGTWNAVTDAGVAWVFDIRQGRAGDATGSFYQVNDNATIFTLKSAYIKGRTLSFDTTLNGTNTNKSGKFELSADAKSFKGTYGNNTITGTLK